MLKVDICRILMEQDKFGLERVRLESTLIKIFTIENDGDPYEKFDLDPNITGEQDWRGVKIKILSSGKKEYDEKLDPDPCVEI